jgi:DNA-directed RNA polymerase specialized sigma24 family protein
MDFHQCCLYSRFPLRVQADHQATRASLLLRLRETHNAAAWEQFVEIYTPIIFGFCRNQRLQDADAADVSQEVMRAVARAMEKFEYDRQRGKFRNWLLTVTRSKLSNFSATANDNHRFSLRFVDGISALQKCMPTQRPRGTISIRAGSRKDG